MNYIKEYLKRKKEHNIDLLIKDAYYKKKEKIKEKNLSFDELQKEIKYFLKCVDEGLYSEPNNVISKIFAMNASP